MKTRTRRNLTITFRMSWQILSKIEAQEDEKDRYNLSFRCFVTTQKVLISLILLVVQDEKIIFTLNIKLMYSSINFWLLILGLSSLNSLVKT